MAMENPSKILAVAVDPTTLQLGWATTSQAPQTRDRDTPIFLKQRPEFRRPVGSYNNQYSAVDERRVARNHVLSVIDWLVRYWDVDMVVLERPVPTLKNYPTQMWILGGIEGVVIGRSRLIWDGYTPAELFKAQGTALKVSPKLAEKAPVVQTALTLLDVHRRFWVSGEWDFLINPAPWDRTDFYKEVKNLG